MIFLTSGISRWIIPLLLLQVYPQAEIGDARLQTIEYQTGQVFVIEAVPGYQATVLLAPDEQVQSVAVGDSAAWQVSVNKAGNQLFIKTSNDSFPTNMTVVTNVRLYAFELIPLSGVSKVMPYTVQFKYPALMQTDGAGDLQDIVGRYRLSGNKSLWPFRIADDGNKTYLLWNPDQDLPAVYARDVSGKEALVNGNMRSGTYVIDAVMPFLIFRIDARTAQAKRELQRAAK